MTAGGDDCTPLHLMGCVDSASKVANNARSSKKDKHYPSSLSFLFPSDLLLSPYIPPSSIPSPSTCNTGLGGAIRILPSEIYVIMGNVV